MRYLAVDVGGTFTDLILYDDADGRLVTHKVPSRTPLEQAIVEGIIEICERAQQSIPSIDYFLHGTTAGTNTLLEGKGARVGMITTKGFRDIVHIGRHRKPYNFSYYQDVPQQSRPLVRRRHRYVVEERMLVDGTELQPLRKEDLNGVVEQILDDGIESVAVCFLASFANAAHEREVAETLDRRAPKLFVSVSSEVCGLHREYERFSTAVVNAYIGPHMRSYLDGMEAQLRSNGFSGGMHLMQSSGGVTTLAAARNVPVNLLLSGPVAGCLGGIEAARRSGFQNVITLDVGGTSADIGVAPAGELKMRHLLDARVAGYAVMVPMLDVETIGAGGGSIAFVDPGGVLRVGPQSAGAEPGPACYARGGKHATVTDAAVVLGRLRPDAFLGGRMRLSAELAHAAVQERVAEPLGMEVKEAALGVVTIATSNMVNAIETNSIRKGYDPREFVLVAAGGAGPMFAADIARTIGIPIVVVPPYPGITAAAGLLASDVRYEQATTVWRELNPAAAPVLERAFADLENQVRTRLARDGFSADRIRLERFIDCRYVGQGYELRVTVPACNVDDGWLATARSRFEELHEREYFGRFPQLPVLIVSVRVAGVGLISRLHWVEQEQEETEPTVDALVGTAEVVFGDVKTSYTLSTRYYARERLRHGNVISGPAIIEQVDSTTVVPPEAQARVDAAGNIILTV